MSNTAIQMKSHSGKSACNKSKHNERKDNHIRNPNFVILYKDNYHTYHYKEPVKKPKTTARMLEVEKGLKSQIATLNAKINTYEKRLNEYQAREKLNLKQIDKLKAKIDDLKLQKEKIPQQKDKRGRPITKRYVEFELSLTNSNHLKYDERVQKAFIKSIEELKQQNPIFQYLKSTSDIMHLDQESLHVHNINKINSKKCLTSILKELDPQNSNRNFLSNMQNQFNEIVRQNMKELNLEIEAQQKGIKYLPLKKYKELTNFNQQEIKANFLQKLENIDQKYNENIVKKEEKEEKFDFENLIKTAKDTDKISKKDEVSKILKNEDKKEENKIEKNTEIEKLSSKDLSNFKELQKKVKEEKENQNENQNEKINEKNRSRGRGRDR